MAAPTKTMDTLVQAVAVSAGTAACFVALALSNNQGEGLAMTSRNPVAAVAWAQANCYNGLLLKASAVRTDADTLLDVAADFESERTHLGIKRACESALRLGKPVIDPQTLPKTTGEPALYDSADVAAAN